MGLSIRGYARHRRVTHQAVRKAIAAGRIVVGADGTIDPAVADQAWQERTAPRMPPPAAAPPAGPRRGGRLRRSGRQRRERVPRARAAALVVDVQTKRLALEQRRGAHLARAGRPEGVLVRAHDPRSLAGVAGARRPAARGVVRARRGCRDGRSRGLTCASISKSSPVSAWTSRFASSCGAVADLAASVALRPATRREDLAAGPSQRSAPRAWRSPRRDS
jgi:hypothetical protein